NTNLDIHLAIQVQRQVSSRAREVSRAGERPDFTACLRNDFREFGLGRSETNDGSELRSNLLDADLVFHSSSKGDRTVHSRGSSRPRWFTNCELVTIISTRLSNRYPSFASRARIVSTVVLSESARLRPRAYANILRQRFSTNSCWRF